MRSVTPGPTPGPSSAGIPTVRSCRRSSPVTPARSARPGPRDPLGAVGERRGRVRQRPRRPPPASSADRRTPPRARRGPLAPADGDLPGDDDRTARPRQRRRAATPATTLPRSDCQSNAPLAVTTRSAPATPLGQPTASATSADTRRQPGAEEREAEPEPAGGAGAGQPGEPRRRRAARAEASRSTRTAPGPSASVRRARSGRARARGPAPAAGVAPFCGANGAGAVQAEQRDVDVGSGDQLDAATAGRAAPRGRRGRRPCTLAEARRRPRPSATAVARRRAPRAARAGVVGRASRRGRPRPGRRRRSTAAAQRARRRRGWSCGSGRGGPAARSVQAARPAPTRRTRSAAGRRRRRAAPSRAPARRAARRRSTGEHVAAEAACSARHEARAAVGQGGTSSSVVARAPRAASPRPARAAASGAVRVPPKQSGAITHAHGGRSLARPHARRSRSDRRERPLPRRNGVRGARAAPRAAAARAGAPTRPPSAASSARATCPPRATPTWSSGPARPRAALGDRAFVLGHHYQRDEVIDFADVTGDSFKLAREAAARPEAEFIVFCGVHFMAESADILTVGRPAGGAARPRRRLLDGRHGRDRPGRGRAGRCSQDAGVARRDRPGHVHELVGGHQGASPAGTAARSARRPTPRSRCAGRSTRSAASTAPARCSSCPTSTWAATPRCSSSACRSTTACVFDPHKPGGGLTAEQLRDARMILWRGHCSVHGRFTRAERRRHPRAVPGVNVLVHPECKHEVVTAADLVGLDRVHHQDARRRRARLRVGDRHRAQPGAPARRGAPGQAACTSSTRRSASARR